MDMKNLLQSSILDVGYNKYKVMVEKTESWIISRGFHENL